jgi:hypothetical protein
MSNWNPKPLRPQDPNPLFKMGDDYTVRKSLSPIEKQRIQDGTPHTKTGRTRLKPGNVEPIDGPELYLHKSVKKEDAPPPPDPDEVVKSFLAKGPEAEPCEEDEKKGLAETAGKVADTAAAGAKTVARTVTGLASQR